MYHSSAYALASQRSFGGQGHMTLPRLRDLCMSMPGATEQIQWGKDLVFKVGGKMFCVANTDPVGDEPAMSFKCDPETFAELCEREGIRPAPYMARAQWVALERFDSLPDRELRPLVTRAYDLIRAKLPKKAQTALAKKKEKNDEASAHGIDGDRRTVARRHDRRRAR